MWVLQCSGPLFGGKRIWLRPGSRHVVGRARSKPAGDDEGAFYGIDNKSISRQHILLQVQTLDPDSPLRSDQKSSLTLQDLSKLGTWLDGERLAPKEARELAGDVHMIKLGNYEGVLRLDWVPICLALTHLSKSKKSFPDDYARLRQLLEPCDIRVTPDVDTKHTTHVVTSKRNSPSTLQGLVMGAYIVTAAYINAVVEATQKTGTDAGGPVAALEKDFNRNWPDPMGFVPPASLEPIPRPGEMYKPDNSRQNVFAGYKFIFCMDNQMSNLMPPITEAGGKALLYPNFEVGKTKPEDVARYVKEAAGEKGLGELEDESEGKGVMLVRIAGKAEDKAITAKDKANNRWVEHFVQTTDLLLNQRSVLQNEFLDPILVNDASSMKQRLQEEDVPSSAAPSSALPSQQSLSRRETDLEMEELPTPLAEREQSPPLPEKAPSRARRLLGRVKSRFKGFDEFDDVDMDKIPELPADDDMIIEDTQANQAITTAQEPVQELEDLSIQPRATRASKRNANTAALDALNPATAKIKRPRLAQPGKDPSPPPDRKPKVFTRTVRKGASAITLEPSPEPEEPKDSSKDSKHKSKFTKNPARIKAISAQALDEDDRRRQELEEELRPLEDGELSQIQAMIEIDSIPIVSRPPRNTAVDEHDPADWDPSWNGRKNFKRFRRRGEGPAPLRGPRLFVPLEQTGKQKALVSLSGSGVLSGGGSEGYVATSGAALRVAIDSGTEEEDDSQFRRRTTGARISGRANPAPAGLSSVDDVIEVTDEDEEALPKDLAEVVRAAKAGATRVTGREDAVSVGSGMSGRKRKATAQGGGAAKRAVARKLGVAEEDSEGSEEELRFRFAGRRKR